MMLLVFVVLLLDLRFFCIVTTFADSVFSGKIDGDIIFNPDRPKEALIKDMKLRSHFQVANDSVRPGAFDSCPMLSQLR